MKSSIDSLIIDTAITNTSGDMAVAGFSGDIIEMLWIMAMHKKYTLAKRLNYWNKQSGKKDHFVYFVVRM